MQPNAQSDGVDAFLQEVVECMLTTLRRTSLGPVFRDSPELLSTGKMLRSRLAYRLGTAARTPRRTLVHASAAVEMIHSASLLHDDVIDGATLRRNLPTFWTRRGTTGAVLLGDMLLFKALDLICQVEEGRHTHELVLRTGELCEGESEQEILLKGLPPRLEACVRIARQKTGALFAFAAYVAGCDRPGCREACREAGYELGTAYQMADDLLDVSGAEDFAGKTLGTDAARDIMTAAGLLDSGTDPAECIEQLTGDAIGRLAPWPQLQQGLRHYLAEDIRPAIDRLLAV